MTKRFMTTKETVALFNWLEENKKLPFRTLKALQVRAQEELGFSINTPAFYRMAKEAGCSRPRRKKQSMEIKSTLIRIVRDMARDVYGDDHPDTKIMEEMVSGLGRAKEKVS
jgi:hypothetical protein